MTPSPSLQSLLAPAEGLEPKDALFSESPIEALDWLKELGEIARASIEPPPAAPEAPAEASASDVPAVAEAPGPARATSAPTTPKAPASEESRLVEALLEYHRLRNPAVGAKAQKTLGSKAGAVRAEGSAAPTSHFSPMDIPVVKHVAPKAATNNVRTSQPLHPILRPKHPK